VSRTVAAKSLPRQDGQYCWRGYCLPSPVSRPLHPRPKYKHQHRVQYTDIGRCTKPFYHALLRHSVDFERQQKKISHTFSALRSPIIDHYKSCCIMFSDKKNLVIHFLFSAPLSSRSLQILLYYFQRQQKLVIHFLLCSPVDSYKSGCIMFSDKKN
jgi:hypothetical protein